jgi:NADH-quinone oxidoreductase subunit H
MQWLTVITEQILKIIIVIIPLFIMVALYPFFERRIIGFMQDRLGPNRLGPFGILQSLADALKLLFKEIIRPQKSNLYLFVIAPVLSFAPAISAWAVIPFTNSFVLADLNVGILYLLAMTSLGVYGIIIAGWASNSRYSFLGALRSAAQVISYEIAMALALLGVLMAARSMNISEIVMSQQGGILHWYCVPLFPLFIVYWISILAETNRAPFDVAEGESELVAGFHVEYSGVPFAIFFLAEYTNMILVSILASLMFLGGWLSPFAAWPAIQNYLNFMPPLLWLLLKTGFIMFTFLWFRATFPRYRYDQIMRLGWKVFIPLTFVWILVEAFAIMLEVKPWF